MVAKHRCSPSLRAGDGPTHAVESDACLDRYWTYWRGPASSTTNPDESQLRVADFGIKPKNDVH